MAGNNSDFLDFSGFSMASPPSDRTSTSTPTNNTFVMREENSGTDGGPSPSVNDPFGPVPHPRTKPSHPAATVNSANQFQGLSPEFSQFKVEALAIGLTDPDKQAAYILQRFQQKEAAKSSGGSTPTMATVQGPKIQLAKWEQKTEDWEMFIHRFERLAVEVGWTEQQKLLHLVSCLEGRAAEVYRRTDRDRQATYSRLKEELQKAFAKTSEQLAEIFHKAMISRNESAIQFASGLREKFLNWYARANDNEAPTVDGLINHIVREQYLKGLPRECRLQIKQHQLCAMADIAQYAENYLAAHREHLLNPPPHKGPSEMPAKGDKEAKPSNPQWSKTRQFSCGYCKSNNHGWKQCLRKGTPKSAAAAATAGPPATANYPQPRLQAPAQSRGSLEPQPGGGKQR